MMADLVDLSKPSFWKSAVVTALCPTIWNIVARYEYRTGAITSLLGSKYAGAYAMAAWIFGFSTYRDIVFGEAMAEQPRLDNEENRGALLATGYSLMAAGTTLVLSSFYHLGITGTFLGDYFGILMKEMVTAFPFNVLSDPMYVGATMNFLGLAITPFTSMIYQKKAEEEAKKAQ